MVFADALTKASRLLELQRLFWASPRRRWTTEELAGRLGVAPRTVRRYIAELSESGRLPVSHDGHRWRLVEAARMEVPPVRLQLEEAAALYLAGRLLERSADEPNPAVHGALAALAEVVPEELGPAFRHLARRDAARPSPFSRAFSVLARGWILGREVELEYAPRTSPSTRRYRFRPYLLEPSAVGSAVYAIGEAHPPGALRVLKIERVRRAALTADQFEAPPLRDLLARLDRAWGVWIADEEPETVVLRFVPEAAPRVRETRWHPSQRLEELPDGSARLELTVTSWRELLPWVLGWGSLCEVLAPEALRAEVASELARGAARYRPPAG